MVNYDYTPNISSAVILTDSGLLEKLLQIDILSDKEVYTLVKDYYERILNHIFESKNKKEISPFIDFFTMPKFIIALTQVMYTITPGEVIRRRLNKMSYDYLILKEHDRDEYVCGLLMALSKTVNRDKIPRLCALPLPENLASLLALSRYSSEKEMINVKRLNRVLMNQPIDTLSEQKIVDIYLALFDHVLPLFIGVMLDVSSMQTLSSNAAEVYSLITLCILDIINELPISDIKKALTMFEEERKIQYSDYPIRLNLQSCSPDDYPRILTAIDSLKSEGVFISTI